MDTIKYAIACICCGVVGIIIGGIAVAYYIARGMFKNF